MVTSQADARVVRVLLQPIEWRRTTLVVVGLGLAVVTMMARRQLDAAFVAAMFVSGCVCGAGVVDLIRARRFPPPWAVGRLVHLRPMIARDARAFAATIDTSVVDENHWRDADRGRHIHAVRRRVQPMLAICERTNGGIVGAIGIDNSPTVHGEWNLGIWIGPQDRGRGFSSDALEAAVGMLDDSVHPSVGASTSVDNVAMQTALRRAGFVEVCRYMHQFHNGDTAAAIRFNRPLLRAAP